jgi:hypothetical protein
LIVTAGLFWGGTRLWPAWRLVVGCIWLGFCPLAIFNSFYFRHLQNDPLMQINERRLQYLSVMSKSALIMVFVALFVGCTMMILHRIKMKAQADDA